MLCETAIHSCDPRDRLIQQFPNGIRKGSRRKPFIADTRAFYDKSSNTLNSPTDGLLPICHLIRQRPAECIGRVGVRLADCGVAIGVWVVPKLSPSKFKMREPFQLQKKEKRGEADPLQERPTNQPTTTTLSLFFPLSQSFSPLFCLSRLTSVGVRSTPLF